MPRLKLYFTYDGTHYSGFQRQKNTSRTIQEVIENKLSIISNTRVNMLASGRTDGGVHARIQVAHVDVPEAVLVLLHKPSPILGESRLVQGLNRLLPPDIRMLKIDHVSGDFHAIAGVRKKTYVYFIDPSPIQLPELKTWSWGLRLPLDWDSMERATSDLIGRHDFKAFCGAGSKVKTTTRTIYEARWGKVRFQGFSYPCELRALRITGSGFLKNMVRSIAGSLVHIGNKKASPDMIAQAIKSGDRRSVGPTAPAHGLWLWDILY